MIAAFSGVTHSRQNYSFNHSGVYLCDTTDRNKNDSSSKKSPSCGINCVTPTVPPNASASLSKLTLVADISSDATRNVQARSLILKPTNGRVQLKPIRANANPQSKSTTCSELCSDRPRPIIDQRFKAISTNFQCAFWALTAVMSKDFG